MADIRAPGNSTTRWRDRAALHVAAPVLLSVYPIALIVGANAGAMPVEPAVVAGLVAAAILATALFFLLLRPFIPQLDARASWLNVFYVGCHTYGLFTPLLMAPPVSLDMSSPVVAAPFTIACAVVATLTVGLKRRRAYDPMPWLVVSLTLVVVTLYRVPGRVAHLASADWKHVADEIIGTARAPATGVQEAATRNIYYIVLDGFGREDTLRAVYDFDLSAFASALRSRGFYVADRAQSNYAQTYLSLASTLNLSYLDDLASRLGPDSQTRLPLDYLIQKAALFAHARRSGYRAVAIGSDYMATRHFDQVDECVCDPYVLDELSLNVLLKTPLAGLGAGSRDFDPHRRQVLDALHTVASVPSSEPLFVFAHVISPHPPFVFHADGSPRHVRGVFGFYDASHFPGTRDEYIDGYRDQVQFVSTEVLRLVDRLLAQPGPDPVIVIHGDHGPSSSLDWSQPDEQGVRERMAILAAYRNPDGALDEYPTATPVSIARMLANRYFSVPMADHVDASWFSTWDRPYAFMRVPPW